MFVSFNRGNHCQSLKILLFHLTDEPPTITQHCNFDEYVVAFYLIDEPATVTLQVRPQDIVANSNPEEAHYVYLHASSQSAALQFDEGTQILLSYKAGYLFIQTDKPIYTPNQEGKSDLCCLATRL